MRAIDVRLHQSLMKKTIRFDDRQGVVFTSSLSRDSNRDMRGNMKITNLMSALSAAALLMGLVGCQSMDNPMARDLLDNLRTRTSVEDNVFTTNSPDVKIKVDPEMTYLGSVRLDKTYKNTLNTRAKELEDSSFQASSYIFGQFNADRRLVKAVVIRSLLASGDPNQVFPVFYPGVMITLDSGKMRILEEEYRYSLSAQQYFFAEEEKGLIGAASLPPCYLIKKIENTMGFGNKSKLQIFYLEDAGLSGCDELNPASLTEQQKQVIQGFTDRSFRNIRFMQPPKQTVDTTSRYVDQEQTAVPPKPAQNAPADKAQLMEEKLRTLKDLHDKNLITDEEFNKKKAEILKEL